MKNDSLDLVGALSVLRRAAIFDTVLNTLSCLWENVTLECDYLHETTQDNQSVKQDSVEFPQIAAESTGTRQSKYCPSAGGHGTQLRRCCHPGRGDRDDLMENLDFGDLIPIPRISSHVETKLPLVGSPSKSTCSDQQQIISP